MKKLLTIVAALGLDNPDKLPEWYTIFEDGKGEVEKFGQFLVDERAWQLLAKYLDRRGVEVVVDYEHQTLKGIEAPASGWCREWRYTPGVGIEAKIDWTEKGREYLAKGEYRYFSPVFGVCKSDSRICTLHSVALTNAPRTNNLQPLIAKLGDAINDQQEDEPMLKMILEALGLAENATEDEVKAAIAKMQKEKKVMVIDAKIPEALGIDAGSDVSTVVASINVLKQEKATMVSREEFNTMQAKLVKREVDEVVAGAMAAGKVTPDQKEWAEEYAQKDLDGFKTYVAKAPVVVPVDKLPGKTPENDEGKIDEATLDVAAKLGHSKEDLEKYLK